MPEPGEQLEAAPLPRAAARDDATGVRAAARVGDAAAGDTAALHERRQSRRLFIVLLVIAAFFAFELVGAKAASSDVLEADAFHLLMDVFALGISLAAMRLATARPSARFTFGLRRAESVAALVNGALVLGVCIELVRDAVADLADATMPKSGIMLAVASAALVVNGISAWLIHGVMGHHGHGHDGHGHDGHGHHGDDHHGDDEDGDGDHGGEGSGHGHGHGHVHGEEGDAHAHAHASAPAPAPAPARARARAPAPASDDEGPHPHAHGPHLNLRGAWLHLMGDALGSLAAFGAGLAIRLGAPAVVDPIASFLVVAILLVGAFRLLRDAGLVLLEAAPARLPVARVRKEVLACAGVTSVHALHVWSLGTGHDAVTVHVVARGGDASLAARIGDRIRDRFMVEYVTVQVDPDDAPAPCAHHDH